MFHVSGLHLHEELPLAPRIALNRKEHDVMAPLAGARLCELLDRQEVLRILSGETDDAALKFSDEAGQVAL